MKSFSSLIGIILIIFSLQSCSYTNQQASTSKLCEKNITGKDVRQKIDDSDRAIMEQTLNQVCGVIPSGQTIAWKNSNNNHKGTFTPDKIYKNAKGQECRRYNYSIQIDGKVEYDYGRACRNLNDIWLKVD